MAALFLFSLPLLLSDVLIRMRNAFFLLCWFSFNVLAQPQESRLREGYAAFERGDGIEALRLLGPLADAGNKYAQYAVAETLLFNRSLPSGQQRDYARAFALHRQAADQDIPGSQTRVGTAYYYGDAVPQDFTMARLWFERAAQNGHPAGQTNLAVMLADGVGGSRDADRAVTLLIDALPRGEANTLNTLANAYARGAGVPLDYAKAQTLYREAALLGHAIAMDNLGNLYRDGLGVEANTQTARLWFERGAALSEPRALTNLGLLYLKGQGVERDTKKAGDYFRMAAQRSHGDAEYNLGLMFLYGNGHDLDHDIGTRWMALAAAHGHELAQGYMVVLADSRHAIQEDRKMLQGYANRLGALGSTQVKRLIAELFDSGRFVPRNPGEAKRWFVLAAHAGDTAAADRLRKFD
jgi:TPR repeat protein